MPPPKVIAFALAGVLIVLIAAVAAIALAGRTPSADQSAGGSSRPTTAVVPSASPTALPTPSASRPAASATPSKAPVERFAADSFVTVVTDDLRVRSKPGVAAGSVKLEPLLWRGSAAYVIRGPVAASGYDWYFVAPLGDVGQSEHVPPPDLGWVAARAKDGTPWLKQKAWACAPNALGYAPGTYEWYRADVFAWPPSGLVGLDCHASRKQKFIAGIGVAEDRCDVAPDVRPSRFDPCGPPYYLVDPDAVISGAPRRLPVVMDPSVDVAWLPKLSPGTVLAVDVAGQYDHSAARTCRPAPDAQDAPPPELMVLRCRAQFVVTSLTVHADP